MAQPNQAIQVDPNAPHPNDLYGRLPYVLPGVQTVRRSGRNRGNVQFNHHHPGGSQFVEALIELPPVKRRRRANGPLRHYDKLSAAQKAVIQPLVFLQLPAEVRNQVYELLMEDICSRPIVYDNCDHQFNLQWEYNFLPRRPAYPLGLILSNSQIKSEFESHLAGRARFVLILRSLKSNLDLADLAAWFNKDPSRFGAPIRYYFFRNLPQARFIRHLTLCINLQPHIEHAGDPGWREFFARFPMLRKITLLFFKTALSDLLQPVAFDVNRIQMTADAGMDRRNAALKGLVIDLISAVQPTTELKFTIDQGDGTFSPLPNFWTVDGRVPANFGRDVVKISPQKNVYFRPRDALWEIMDQQEHEEFTEECIVYEQKYGRLHRQVASEEIEHIYNRYSRLKGTNAHQDA